MLLEEHKQVTRLRRLVEELLGGQTGAEHG
jgi:hypothetical protein